MKRMWNSSFSGAASADLTSNGYVLDRSAARLGRLEPVPLAERQDAAALNRRLVRDGYLYLTDYLDPAIVLSFREYYFAELADTGLVKPGTPPVEGVAAEDQSGFDRAVFRAALFGGIVPGERYEQLCRDPAITAFFRLLFGTPELHLHRRKIIRHGVPGQAGIGTATQAHYDLVYLREGTDRLLSCWIPLGDCPVSRGGLVYLEGSHRRVRADEKAGRLKHPAKSMTADLPALADENDSRWLAADYRAGDIVVHSPYTIHASLDNQDPDGVMRLSTDIRYQSAHDPIDSRWQNHWRYDDGL
jgi:ectoine hydroxylase-related dioxygenase (phytanoyl-CoA dioxygenase family)